MRALSGRRADLWIDCVVTLVRGFSRSYLLFSEVIYIIMFVVEGCVTDHEFGDAYANSLWCYALRSNLIATSFSELIILSHNEEYV